ncbi:pimeloyl-ACP methyl ester carboxylesterase [Bradyrhizobium sp. USDA 4011]
MTTHNTARNQFVEVGGVHYAYRRFGKLDGTPLLLLPHFIATMDWWDPLLVDSLAETREVILFDNRGVGLSSGETPDRIAMMAADVHAFIHGLGLTRVDVLGFSIGGMVAQELVLLYPDDVRKLLLVGTGPRGGEGMQQPKPDVVKALTEAGPDPKSARPFLFFSQTENGRTEAARFMARNAERTADLDPGPSMQTMQAQSEALGEWGHAATHADYLARLRVLPHPTLVANGNNDIMVSTINSYILSQAIPRAQLIIYPDSGHGALFQHARLFVEHTNLFLERSDI